MKAEMKDLDSLVGYQEGTVASRTLIKKDAGTVTFFAFDKGEGLSEHTAPFDAMVLVTDGEAEVTISGETFSLKSGQTITMPANEPHKVYATDKFKMLLVMVKD